MVICTSWVLNLRQSVRNGMQSWTDEQPLPDVPAITKMAAKAMATVAGTCGPPTSREVWEHDCQVLSHVIAPQPSEFAGPSWFCE